MCVSIQKISWNARRRVTMKKFLESYEKLLQSTNYQAAFMMAMNMNNRF